MRRRYRHTVAAQKRIFNEYALMSPPDALRAEGAAHAAGVVSAVAPRALREWVDMQEELDGESVFLADLEPWRRGEVLDLNEAEESQAAR